TPQQMIVRQCIRLDAEIGRECGTASLRGAPHGAIASHRASLNQTVNFLGDLADWSGQRTSNHLIRRALRPQIGELRDVRRGPLHSPTPRNSQPAPARMTTQRTALRTMATVKLRIAHTSLRKDLPTETTQPAESAHAFSARWSSGC